MKQAGTTVVNTASMWSLFQKLFSPVELKCRLTKPVVSCFHYIMFMVTGFKHIALPL